MAEYVSWLDQLTHKLLHQKTTLVPIHAEDVTPGVFPTGTFEFGGIIKSRASGVAPGANRFWDGMELAHSGSTPYIDFHRSTNPEEATDYNMRIILEANELLHIYSSAGTNWGTLRVANAKLGSYGWSNSYAHFGHPDYMDANSIAYCLLDGPETILNGRNGGGGVKLRYNGGDKVIIETDGQRNYDWVRCMNSGVGIYFAAGGGGWFCNSGDNHVRAYSGNTYSGEFRIGLGVWGGGHAVGGHYDWRGNGGCGILQRWDGRVWCRSGTNEFTITVNGSDFFNVNNSGGWCDFRANLPALGGTTMVFAGSQQMGPTSSRADIKTDIRPAGLGSNNPLWSFKVRKFKWDPEKLANGKEINDRHPDGVYGLIVDEVHELLPESTHPSPHDGKPMGFDQQVLNAVMVDAIQLLKSEVDTLKKGK